MQWICLKSTRLLYEVARHSTKMVFSMEKHSQTSVSIVPPAPVRPLNAFFRYFKEKLKDNQDVPKEEEKLKLLKQDVPKQAYKSTERLSKIAMEWKALPIEKKQIYEIQYAEDINKFKILEEKWWNGLTEDQKHQYKSLKTEKKIKAAKRRLQKQISSLEKPKRYLTPLNFFIRQNMSRNNSTNMLATRSKEESRNFMKTLSHRWTTLSADEKKIYNEMAEEDAVRYKRELAFWNLKMLTEGKGHLLQLSKNLLKEIRVERKKRRNE